MCNLNAVNYRTGEHKASAPINPAAQVALLLLPEDKTAQMLRTAEMYFKNLEALILSRKP